MPGRGGSPPKSMTRLIRKRQSGWRAKRKSAVSLMVFAKTDRLMDGIGKDIILC